jgi:diguanylate cyclase (GGDEF)-like protein
VLLTRTEEAEDSSRRDTLTGVSNRPWLDRTLDREFTQAVVFGRDLSIAHIDIDRFKSINERHGTQVGDRVLRSCAQVVQACIRGSDMVARFSGEEFMVVLPGADREIARQVAQRVLGALASTDHDPETGGVNITASIGLATYTMKRRFPSTLALLEAADHALYAAKLCGRNRVESFEELPTTGRGKKEAVGS